VRSRPRDLTAPEPPSAGFGALKSRWRDLSGREPVLAQDGREGWPAPLGGETAPLWPIVKGLTRFPDVSEFLRSYLTVFIFGCVAVGLVGAVLGLGSLLRPKRPRPEKLIAYESGVDPVGEGWTQAEIRYYIFALLFVMFDVEAVFIFPWATRLEAYGTFGVVEMSVFIGVLALGILYAWRKKVLRWI
jgi:NADH-quinone oxidoreductase subunit A